MMSPCVSSATLSANIAITFPSHEPPKVQVNAMNKHKDIRRSTALSSEKAGAADGYHLITLVTNKRVQVFASKELAKIAMEVILFVERKKGFRLRGFIVMPDHIHLICEPMRSLHSVILDIKKLISLLSISHLSIHGRSLLASIESPNRSRNKALFQLWRKAYHHALIPTEEKLTEALRYLYEHPVRSGICATAFEYEFSDIHRHLGPGGRADPGRPYPFPAEKPRVPVSHAGKIAKARPGPASVS